MGLLEPITHKEEIESLLNDAQSMYDKAVKRFEKQKAKTANSLERLGEQKLEAWSGDMQDFLTAFGRFNHIQMVSKEDHLYHFTGRDEQPQALMINMQRASMTANEVLKTGALAIGAGALVGIASYGGAMMFAHASTGTAIAALSGAAKTNATLAWFGGGSLATGGLGKLGGKVVLCGIVIAPILLVAGVITAAKSAEKLAEAKKVHAEAENAVAQMNTVISGMAGIERLSENYRQFLSDLSALFRPFIAEMDQISQDYTPGTDGKINFDDLTEMEQKTLHISWLLAQLYYHGLSTTILTEEGNIASEAKSILKKSKKEYRSISDEVSKLNKEKEDIWTLLTTAASAFDTAYKNYYDKKSIAGIDLLSFGKKKIGLCADNIKTYVDLLSAFEDIDISCSLYHKGFPQDAGTVFDVMQHAALCADAWSITVNNPAFTPAIIETATYNGMAFLKEASLQQDLPQYLLEVDKHDFSLWFAEALPPAEDERLVFAGISARQIRSVESVVKGITGKENLEQATEVNRFVINIVHKMNAAAKAMEDISVQINMGLECFQKVEKVLKPFIFEIDSIAKNYSATKETPMLFSQLLESEQRVIELSWSIAQLQYNLFNASVLPAKNGEESASMATVVSTVTRELSLLPRETFKMKGSYAMAANIIWKPFAQKMLFVNLVAMLLFIALGVIQLIQANWYGFIGLVGAVIALPVFIYFKDLPQSKLFMWRIIRLISATVLVFGVELLGLVG